MKDLLFRKRKSLVCTAGNTWYHEELDFDLPSDYAIEVLAVEFGFNGYQLSSAASELVDMVLSSDATPGYVNGALGTGEAGEDNDTIVMHGIFGTLTTSGQTVMPKVFHIPLPEGLVFAKDLHFHGQSINAGHVLWICVYYRMFKITDVDVAKLVARARA